MGLRFRRSINLGHGLRLNFGKSGVGLSAGVKGARVSINSNGRKTTSVGIPGTGISYVKTEKMGGKQNDNSDIPPTIPNNNNLLGSDPPPKKKRGCGTFLILAIIFAIIAYLFQQCTGGASTATSSAPSSSISLSAVSSNSSSLASGDSSEDHESSATLSQAPSSTSNTKAASSKGGSVTTNAAPKTKAETSSNENTNDLNRTVYWTKTGKSYHFDKNCRYLSRSKNIISGTLKEALSEGKKDPCNECAY